MDIGRPDNRPSDDGRLRRKKISRHQRRDAGNNVSADHSATGRCNLRHNVGHPGYRGRKICGSGKMARIPSPVSDIHFDFDSSSIRPDARDILKENADYFMNNRISSIIIEGHCDEKGTYEYNMALGERRAQETKKYLVNLGVKESLMKTVSFGEENPLDPASTEEAWAKNRRAHFVVNP